MPISSASNRIFKAEDPVMETDLSLLAKVNEYQQDKFDAGEKDLQTEVNNWSMLANVAKPADQQYIRTKLNNLVSGIDNLGGVNLAEPNNVNALKSLGYNMYGDDNVMNPVITTRKMNALQQDIYNKTNGKNAKDYDSVYGEYLTNQYSSWLNDGKQGTKFDGPTSLPQGSFDNYNKKISDALNKLTPDINEAPQNATDALNYYQVGDKFIKKERVEAAISAATSSQDLDIMSAHAWKQMSGMPDNYLVGLQNNSYDAKLTNLQETYNDLQHNKATTSDYAQKELFTSQMDQIKNSIDGINAQKKSLPQLQQGQQLDEGTRKGLRDSLFNDAFKDQYANARAFDQKKIELKMNQGKAFQIKSDQTAWMFGKNYDLKVADLKLKGEDLELKKQAAMIKLYGMYNSTPGQLGQMGVYGPAQTAPLSIIPNNGKDDSIMLSNDVVKQADANYIAKANNFYTNGYNYLLSKDADLYGKYLKKDNDGNWIPTDDAAKTILNKGIDTAMSNFGNIANMSIKERNGLKLTDGDLALFDASKDLGEAQLYKQQMQVLTNQVFTSAGLVPPSQQTVTIPFKDGTSATVTYDKLKEMKDRDDPMLKEWEGKAQNVNPEAMMNKELGDAKSKIMKSWKDNFDNTKLAELKKETDKIEARYSGSTGIFKEIGRGLGLTSANSVTAAEDEVSGYYDNSAVNDAWKKASQNFNVYGSSVSLPKLKNGKPSEQLASYLGTVIREQHPDVAGGVQNDDIDLQRIWAVPDLTAKGPNKVKYMAEVRYQKGAGSDKEGKDTKGDRLVNVDLTDQVLRDHDSANGGYFGNLYPSDNTQVVYGMLLNNEGKTPMDKNDGYSSALQTHSSALLTHRYQIVSMKNGREGVDGYRVNILIPKGKDQNGVPQFQTFPVINFDAITPASKTITNTFPANFKYVQDYMDEQFSSSDKAREFYQRHGIPYLPDQQQQPSQQQQQPTQ